MMVLRPEGILPERRHQIEMASARGELEEPDAFVYESRS